jgi:hypothetical protein
VVVGEIDRLSARRRARGVWSEPGAPVLRRNTLLVVSEVGYTGVLGSEAGWGGFGWVLRLFLPVVMLRSVWLERLDFCGVCEGPCTTSGDGSSLMLSLLVWDRCCLAICFVFQIENPV